MNRMQADYIVVGAGTAGALVAARLSENPAASVILVELGGMDTNPAIYDRDMNAMFGLWNPQGEENWGYATVSQPALDGRVIDVARGKVIGGSSAVNAMIHVRGNRRDYDAWAALGNPGWSYDDVLPYFKKSETYHGQPSDHHGTGGELSIIDYFEPPPVVVAFVEAAADILGGTPGNDLNGPEQEAGPGYYQSTRTTDRIRVTSASAFITPNLDRPNFTLLIHHRATRILVEDGRAVGIACTGPDGEVELAASREVILCGGAYETPKLMMLSGLGPADHLGEFGIPVVRDIPGVGQNLQDHMLLGVAYECNIPQPAPEMLAVGGLFTWTGTGRNSPDLQYFFGPVQFVPQEFMTPNPGFTFAPILGQPLSRGTIRLASADPVDNAVLDPQYLSAEEDVAVFEHGIRLARQLVQHPAFDPFRGRELAPGPEATTSEDIRAYIRKAAGTVWHPVGTCKMGPDTDPMAVVDSQLRVRGIVGLRVADASVMPDLVNANPNATIFMIGEKAADMILNA